MIDGDFEIDGYLLGRNHPVNVIEVSPGAAEWRDQDSLNPVGNNRQFGRDYLTPPTWQLGIAVNTSDQAAALTALDDLARIWKRNRTRPGAEGLLRYQVGGRVRRVYGRARNFAPEPNLNFIRQGYVAATGEFVTTDPLHYTEDAHRRTLTLLPGETGYHPLPTALPFTFIGGGPRHGLIDVEGGADTPVEIEVHGPVINPTVTIGDHRIPMTLELAYDQWITIDTRTSTATRNDGASIRGDISRRTYLPNIKLEPGPSEIIFDGSDPTGTSTCTVTWHPAFDGF